MKRGLAGAFVWSVEMDDFGGTCGEGKYPLMSEITKILKPYNGMKQETHWTPKPTDAAVWTQKPKPTWRPKPTQPKPKWQPKAEKPKSKPTWAPKPKPTWTPKVTSRPAVQRPEKPTWSRTKKPSWNKPQNKRPSWNRPQKKKPSWQKPKYEKPSWQKPTFRPVTKPPSAGAYAIGGLAHLTPRMSEQKIFVMLHKDYFEATSITFSAM